MEPPSSSSFSSPNSNGSQDWKVRLDALKKCSEHVPATKLLSIISPFLLHLCKESSSSDRTQAIHYLMEEWYVKQAKFDVEVISAYPISTYDGCCFQCDSVLVRYGCFLTSHCKHCKASPSLTVWFLQDLLEYRYKIHPVQIEKIFCEYISKVSKHRTQTS